MSGVSADSGVWAVIGLTTNTVEHLENTRTSKEALRQTWPAMLRLDCSLPAYGRPRHGLAPPRDPDYAKPNSLSNEWNSVLVVDVSSIFRYRCVSLASCSSSVGIPRKRQAICENTESASNLRPQSFRAGSQSLVWTTFMAHSKNDALPWVS